MRRVRQLLTVSLILGMILEPAAAFAQTKACSMQCQPYFSLKDQLKSNPTMLTDPAQACKIPPSHLSVGPRCEAIKINETALKINTRVVTMYVVASIACTLACAAQTGLITAVASPILTPLCMGTVITSTAADLQGLSQLQKEAKESLNGLSMIASGGAVVNAGASIAGGLSTNGSSGPCGSMTTSVLVSTAKYASIPSEKTNIEKNCATVQKESLVLSGVPGISTCPSANPGTTAAHTTSLTGVGTSGTQGARGARSGIRGGSAEASPGPSDELQFNDATVASAATAGFEKAVNPNGLKELYNKAAELGINAKDIENKIANGMPPSDVIASQNLEDMPQESQDELVKNIKTLENLALNGKLFNNSVVGSTYAASGGGGRPGMLPQLRPMNGMKTPVVSGTAKINEIGFNGQAQIGSGIDMGTNIWHPYWTGTIFDIVTQRTALSRDRVEQVEWANPANKMTTGSNLGVVLPQVQQQRAPGAVAEQQQQQAPPAANTGIGNQFADPSQEIK